MDKTATIFTSDQGFCFGEHGGMFGKMTFDKRVGPSAEAVPGVQAETEDID